MLITKVSETRARESRRGPEAIVTANVGDLITKTEDICRNVIYKNDESSSSQKFRLKSQGR